MTEYGVRVLDCGEKPLPVLVKIRPILVVSPRAAKQLAANGNPFVLVEGVSRYQAEYLSKCLQNLDARIDIFVSSPCPSDCETHG